MIESSSELRVGDRVRYAAGTVSGAARKGEAGTIVAISSDRTGVDVMFDDGLERGVTAALLELA
jgi:hypothetical protein